MNKFAEYMKENLERGNEYAKSIADTMQSLGGEVSKKATEFIAEGFEHGKEFLGCKSFDDVINWGEKLVQKNIETIVHASSSICGKACEEINKVNSEVAKKFAHSMANMKDKCEGGEAS